MLHQTHEVIAAPLIPFCKGCRRRGAGLGGAVLAEVLAGSTPPDVTQRQPADSYMSVSKLSRATHSSECSRERDIQVLPG